MPRDALSSRAWTAWFFVADSQLNQRKKNMLSLKNLQENLAIYKKKHFQNSPGDAIQ